MGFGVVPCSGCVSGGVSKTVLIGFWRLAGAAKSNSETSWEGNVSSKATWADRLSNEVSVVSLITFSRLVGAAEGNPETFRESSGAEKSGLVVGMRKN